MKGANQVPMDYYPSRMQSEEEIKWLMDSASAANFNILRIWGGGMYMTDFFYEYADRTGMMIWQDMMFSCRFYPYVNDEYLENSMVEVKE
jgi:beta-mannosidase